jgi:hypothetical protein
MQSTLPSRLYFENNVGRLLEHPEGFVVFEYKPGPRQFADLQALLTHTRNLLERNQWHRMLGDQRLMMPFTKEESTWIVHHWLDASRQRPGGLHAGILVSGEDFGLIPPDQVGKEATIAALTYRLFDQEEHAVVWLRQITQA